MQKLIRAVLRWLIGMEALVFALNLATPFKIAPGTGIPARPGVALFAALSLLYGAAWWTTRPPRTRREYVAALCCLLNLAAALPLIHYIRPFSANAGFLAVNGLLLTLNVAGIFLFLQPLSQSVGRAPQRVYRTPRDCTSRATDLLFQALMVVAFWQSWRLWDRWAGPHGISPAPLSLGLLAFGLALMVMTSIHELGHALVGYAVGMKLLSFTVGPFSWRRIEGRIRFKLIAPSLGGSVQNLPLQNLSPRHEVLMLLGGVIANLCSAPIFIWAALHVRGTGPEYAYEFLYALVVLSTIAALGNLLPIRFKGEIYSDGARILQVLTHSPAMDYRRTMQRLQSTLYTPLRLRDLDPATFQQIAVERADNLTGLHAHICAAGIFNELGKTEEAGAELAAAEAYYDNFAIDLPALLHTTFICHHAMSRRDAAVARLWWDRMSRKKYDPKKVDFLLASSSLAWIEGRAAEAEMIWQQADSVARALPPFGAYETDSDSVAMLRTLLDGPARPLVVPTMVAPDQRETKPAAWPTVRHAFMIAGVTAILLAVALVPPEYSGSLLWHATHGNQATVGSYRLTLPLRWHPSSVNLRGVVSIRNAGDLESGSLVFVSGDRYEDDQQKDDQSDADDQSDDQQEDHSETPIAAVNPAPVPIQWIDVPVETRRSNLSCHRMLAPAGQADTYDNLYCRVANSSDTFFYNGPAATEPEARAILATLQ